MRPIDADLMIKNLEKDYNSFMEQGHKKLANAILDVLIPTINCQPTADMTVHGHWIYNHGCQCSVCNRMSKNLSTYCQWCGAKMDGKVKE